MPTRQYLGGRIRQWRTEVRNLILTHKLTTFLWFGVILPIVIGLLRIIWLTYEAKNTGFETKTLWDWMDLLLVPAALAVGLWWLNRSEKNNEQRIAADRLRESSLQAYFNTMTRLILEGVNETKSEGERLRRSVARTHTLSVLRNLDMVRKGIVLQFLFESGLITDTPFVDLRLADFSKAHLREFPLQGVIMRGVVLREANLERAKLSGAKLRYADLRWVNLQNADLSKAELQKVDAEYGNFRGANLDGATLREAHLWHADLRGAVLRAADFQQATLSNADLRDTNLEDAILESADLRQADLRGARVTDEQLEKALSLEDALMPDGSRYKTKIQATQS